MLALSAVTRWARAVTGHSASGEDARLLTLRAGGADAGVLQNDFVCVTLSAYDGGTVIMASQACVFLGN